MQVTQDPHDISSEKVYTMTGMKRKIALFNLFDFVSFFVFVIWVIMFIRLFILNPYRVVGQSMEPTFTNGDFIVVDMVTPKVWEFERGDIIVAVPEWKDVPVIKRIVGLPGETVKISEGVVYICDEATQTVEDCEQLSEFYLPDGMVTETNTCGVSEFIIEGWFFVMGDNRWRSTDSRCCFGLRCYENAPYEIYDRNIIGKVALKVYPKLDPFW